MNLLLKVNNLSYRDFKNINIDFYKENIYYIVGGNNSGKTTLFKLFSSLIMTEDSIMCDDILLNSKNQSIYLKEIGIVEKVNKYSFIFNNVLDELLYPLLNLGHSKKQSLTIIKNKLSFFETEYFLNKKIKELTIDERQELLIIISLLHNPTVLLMDDVLNVFSSNKKEKILSKLNILKKDMVIINFTSYIDNINYVDKIILINNYKIIKEMDIETLFNNDKLLYDNNIEVPFIIDLTSKLKMYGVVNKNYYDIKEMVDDIWE